MAGLESKIEEIITPSLIDLGFSVVRVKVIDGGKRRLQIMAEKLDESGMSLDDCASVSRVVSALMDVENPITSSYELEVSSPGVERPLTKLADYVKYVGRKAKFGLYAPVEGKRKFSGKINSVAGENIKAGLLDEEKEIEFEFENIASAHLIFDEEEFKKKLKNK